MPLANKSMSDNQQNQRLTGLPRRFVNDQLLEEEQAREAISQAKRQRLPFVNYLVQENILEAAVIAQVASVEFGVPLLDINAVSTDHVPKSIVPEKLIRQNYALPLFRRGANLFVAVADPTNITALDEIKFSTGLNTEPVLVEADKLQEFIEKSLEENSTSMEGLTDADLDNLDISSDDDKDDNPELTAGTGDDAPVVRFVNKVLLDAINKGASDIHFEPFEKIYQVRFRQDGILKKIASPPVGLGNRISARIKVMSSLDIAERRVPQDGRLKINLSRTRSIDFRVNTCPTLWGEKIVMRILDASASQMGIEALGFEDEQKASLMKAIMKPHGLVLVTGPTGSGKTVSMYTCLNILNTEDRNISTAEDPVEIQVKGINQVNVNPKQGFHFDDALRAFLRQDPDIIMVGEIRDLNTASIAVKAAQTGHLVLSTLHTNDAPQTISRLQQMGVPAFNIATSISLVMAQRLARRLCDKCKESVEIPAEALIQEGFNAEEVDDIQLFHANAKGCQACYAGYKGRVGVYQVMPMTERLTELILANANAQELSRQAKAEGVINLRRAGLNKVKLGLTTLEEINRVTAE